MNSLWLPSRGLDRFENVRCEPVEKDIDDQALAYRDLNMIFTQLGSGKLEGKFCSVNLGQVSIYDSQHNRSIEKQISVPSGNFGVFILAEQSAPFYACGVEITQDRVYVLPPGGGSIVVCPADSNIIMISIDRAALIHNDGLISEAAEWLMQLDRRGAVLDSAPLAARLRLDVLSALDSTERSNLPEAKEVIDRATAFRIASSFTMEALQSTPFAVHQRSVSFERFWRARKLLLENLRTASECGLQSLSGLGSRRSTEQAFSDHVFMGPLAYYRVVRLHSVRRKLMEVGRLGQSIGDIASEDGFWDWSRFSTYYRRHFGELPSETRSRLEAA